MSETKHTPACTPFRTEWRDGKWCIIGRREADIILGSPIAVVMIEADADTIVTACNSHAALLAACKEAEELCKRGNDPDDGSRGVWPSLVTELRAAIAKAAT